MVEISLDRDRGRIRVHRVWMAVDGGIIVQPDMARANIESGIVYGISSVLKERATVKDGAVVQSNFHDYELLRMADAPEEIHIEFLDRDTAPTGLGEIGNRAPELLAPFVLQPDEIDPEREGLVADGQPEGTLDCGTA